jgi:hypothetical protein
MQRRQKSIGCKADPHHMIPSCCDNDDMREIFCPFWRQGWHRAVLPMNTIYSGVEERHCNIGERFSVLAHSSKIAGVFEDAVAD